MLYGSASVLLYLPGMSSLACPRKIRFLIFLDGSQDICLDNFLTGFLPNSMLPIHFPPHLRAVIITEAGVWDRGGS